MNLFYFRYKLYNNLQKLPCESLEFSISTRRRLYFSFSRISSALMPPASSFLTTASASYFFCFFRYFLCSVFAFFASSLANSFLADFSSDFLAFRSAFFSSISFWIASTSAVRFWITDCSSLRSGMQSRILGGSCFLWFWTFLCSSFNI